MSIEAEVYKFLNANEDISEIVGANIWRQWLPESYDFSGPAITITTVADNPVHMLDGASGASVARIQLDFWSLDDECELLAGDVRELLYGYDGPMGAVDISECNLDNAFPLDEKREEGSDVWIRRVTCDYVISYTVPQN